MKITKRQLKRMIREEAETLEYPKSKNVTDIDIDHDSPEDVEPIEDAWAGGQNIHNSIDHSKSTGAEPNTLGQEILKISERRRSVKKQLRKIVNKEKRKSLREQDEAVPEGRNGHHWPRVDWTNVNDLVDKWYDAELKAFDKGDPSMMAMGDTVTDARAAWKDQVDEAAIDMENEMTRRVRQLAYQTMEEFTDKLINGDYS